MDRDPPLCRLDTFRQRIQRRRNTVQLPAPVVTDNDAIAAVLDREQRILRREDALDVDVHLGNGSKPGNLLRPRMAIGVQGHEA